MIACSKMRIELSIDKNVKLNRMERNFASGEPTMMCTVNVDLTEYFQTRDIVYCMSQRNVSKTGLSFLLKSKYLIKLIN